METELKACEKCGGTETRNFCGGVTCKKCGHDEGSPEDWNRRAMPECVRAILAATARVADPNGDIRPSMAKVRKYYGEGGE